MSVLYYRPWISEFPYRYGEPSSLDHQTYITDPQDNVDAENFRIYHQWGYIILYLLTFLAGFGFNLFFIMAFLAPTNWMIRLTGKDPNSGWFTVQEKQYWFEQKSTFHNLPHIALLLLSIRDLVSTLIFIPATMDYLIIHYTFWHSKTSAGCKCLAFFDYGLTFVYPVLLITYLVTLCRARLRRLSAESSSVGYNVDEALTPTSSDYQKQFYELMRDHETEKDWEEQNKSCSHHWVNSNRDDNCYKSSSFNNQRHQFQHCHKQDVNKPKSVTTLSSKSYSQLLQQRPRSPSHYTDNQCHETTLPTMNNLVKSPSAFAIDAPPILLYPLRSLSPLKLSLGLFTSIFIPSLLLFGTPAAVFMNHDGHTKPGCFLPIHTSTTGLVTLGGEYPDDSKFTVLDSAFNYAITFTIFNYIISPFIMLVLIIVNVAFGLKLPDHFKYVKLGVLLFIVYLISRSPLDILQLGGLLDATRGFQRKTFHLKQDLFVIWICLLAPVINPVLCFSVEVKYRRASKFVFWQLVCAVRDVVFPSSGTLHVKPMTYELTPQSPTNIEVNQSVDDVARKTEDRCKISSNDQNTHGIPHHNHHHQKTQETNVL